MIKECLTETLNALKGLFLDIGEATTDNYQQFRTDISYYRNIPSIDLSNRVNRFAKLSTDVLCFTVAPVLFIFLAVILGIMCIPAFIVEGIGLSARHYYHESRR